MNLRLGRSRRHHLGTEADRTAFRTLHTASLLSNALRTGLDTASAERSVCHLRDLLGASAVALSDADAVLAWSGRGESHRAAAHDLVPRALEEGGTSIHEHQRFACGDAGCDLRRAVVAVLTVGGTVVGTLQVFDPRPSAGLVRATTELGTWISGQLELAEVDGHRTRLMEAEVRALRAQISPHFVFNCLNAIASFVRTDPDRARELLVQFADFTRYSFRKHGEYTPLADELRSIQCYLTLEQARYGDRLQVTLRIAPEVLSVLVPVFSVQPLVENGVRHGLADKVGGGRITIVAEDRGQEAVVWVEDDGVGEEPGRVREALAGDAQVDSVGLGNVDGRLRSAFGDAYGLVVETAPGAGTKVTMRVPKYAAGVHQ